MYKTLKPLTFCYVRHDGPSKAEGYKLTIPAGGFFQCNGFQRIKEHAYVYVATCWDSNQTQMEGYIPATEVTNESVVLVKR